MSAWSILTDSYAASPRTWDSAVRWSPAYGPHYPTALRLGPLDHVGAESQRCESRPGCLAIFRQTPRLPMSSESMCVCGGKPSYHDPCTRVKWLIAPRGTLCPFVAPAGRSREHAWHPRLSQNYFRCSRALRMSCRSLEQIRPGMVRSRTHGELLATDVKM